MFISSWKIEKRTLPEHISTKKQVKSTKNIWLTFTKFSFIKVGMDTQNTKKINFGTKSQLAKLIASENITVQHNQVKTASV